MSVLSSLSDFVDRDHDAFCHTNTWTRTRTQLRVILHTVPYLPPLMQHDARLWSLSNDFTPRISSTSMTPDRIFQKAPQHIAANVPL